MNSAAFVNSLRLKPEIGPAFFGDGSGDIVHFCENHNPDALPEPPSFWEDFWGRRWFQINGEIYFVYKGDIIEDYVREIQKGWEEFGS